MKAQITAKYLQFLNSKNTKKNSGFTLIELLVVIIIIGILSAIALPSFLNQAAKARGAEAKANVGAMNRAQQAYFLEQQSFTDKPADLGLSLDLETENYTYSAAANDDLKTGVTNLGTSRKADIKSFVGGTFYTASTDTEQGNTKTILCEAKTADDAPAVAPAKPASATAEPTCDTTTLVIK